MSLTNSLSWVAFASQYPSLSAQQPLILAVGKRNQFGTAGIGNLLRDFRLTRGLLNGDGFAALSGKSEDRPRVQASAEQQSRLRVGPAFADAAPQCLGQRAFRIGANCGRGCCVIFRKLVRVSRCDLAIAEDEGFAGGNLFRARECGEVIPVNGAEQHSLKHRVPVQSALINKIQRNGGEFVGENELARGLAIKNRTSA